MSTLPGAEPIAELRHRLQEHLAVIYPDADHPALAERLVKVPV